MHGWLELANNPIAGTSLACYYKLVLIHAADPQAISPDNPVDENDLVRLGRQAAAEVKQPRWVYVLDVDCQGKCILLCPRSYSETPDPSEGEHPPSRSKRP